VLGDLANAVGNEQTNILGLNAYRFPSAYNLYCSRKFNTGFDQNLYRPLIKHDNRLRADELHL